MARDAGSDVGGRLKVIRESAACTAYRAPVDIAIRRRRLGSGFITTSRLPSFKGLVGMPVSDDLQWSGRQHHLDKKKALPISRDVVLRNRGVVRKTSHNTRRKQIQTLTRDGILRVRSEIHWDRHQP